MSSHDQACRKSEVQEGCIVESRRGVMIVHQSSCNEYSFFRSAAVIALDFIKFGSFSEKKYGEPLDELICVYVFEKALSAGQMIDFGDPVCR